MTILVTGGAGYVGYSVVKSLARKYPQSKIIIHDSLSKSKLENVTPLLNLFPNVSMTPWENAASILLKTRKRYSSPARCLLSKRSSIPKSIIASLGFTGTPDFLPPTTATARL